MWRSPKSVTEIHLRVLDKLKVGQTVTLWLRRNVNFDTYQRILLFSACLILTLQLALANRFGPAVRAEIDQLRLSRSTICTLPTAFCSCLN